MSHHLRQTTRCSSTVSSVVYAWQLIMNHSLTQYNSLSLDMTQQQLNKCVCLSDFRQAAKTILPTSSFLYIDSGSEDQKTLKENESSFHRLMIIPRILISSSKTNLSTSIFGIPLALPFGFAPWAMNGLCHPQAEVIPARVAAKNKIIYSLSILANKSFSEVAASNSGGFRLMQMYVSNDWALTQSQIRLAEKYGFTGLAITVDAQVLGVRKNQLKYPLNSSHLTFPILEEIKANSTSTQQEKQYKENKRFLANRDLSLRWDTIKKIRSITKLKIVLKGIMHPKDAQIAIDYADAIWVSNHGGRQLDGVSSTINILPLIKSAVGDKIPILMDGGVRTGNDVFKCLALGANYVFVARPVAYSLLFGEAGVTKLVRILQDQLNRALILVGCKSLADVKADSVIPQPTL